MTRHFARKFQTLSVIALFVAGIGALTVLAAPAIAQNPVPFIDQPLVPDATSPGGAGFTLTVNGAWFVAASVVNWNGSPRATTFVSSSRLTAAILASDIATASTASVTVVNPSPGGGASNAIFFPIAAPETSVSFVPVVTYGSGGGPTFSMTTGDFRGNGKTDIAAVNCGSDGNCVSATEGSVGILLGNGDGTFQSVVTYPSGGYGTLSIAAGDVNGDGKMDLVVTNICGSSNTCEMDSATIGVLLGNGNGTFQAPLVFPTGGFPSQYLAIADLNGDGKLDVVVGNCDPAQNCFTGSGMGSVSVLLGNGDGTFAAPVLYPSGGLNALGVGIADVNGDGKPDIVVANCGIANSETADCSETQVLSVLFGNGDGTFQAPINTTWNGPSAGAEALADVNGDGIPDALLGNQNGITVFLGNGDGTFQPGVAYETGGNGAGAVLLADLNGDGILDLMSASGGLAVLLGNGNGTFQEATDYATGGTASGINVADLTGDGRLDVIASDLCAPGSGPCSGLVGVLLSELRTTTTLVSSLNPSVYGQSVTFTATVTSSFGTPTGTVQLYNGSVAIGSATLASGKALIPVSSLLAGSSSITAAYQGFAAFGPSTSGSLTQIVNVATTTTSVASSPNPGHPKQEITYTATVTSQYSGGATGTVTFKDGAATIATVNLSGNHAAYRTRYSMVGTHSITAVYSGDGNNAGSTSPMLTEDINGATKTVVTTSGSPSIVGQPVTFTATVTSIFGTIPNGELVTFADDGTAVGTGSTSAGVATFTTSSLTVGTHHIKATYAGDAEFRTSSGPVRQVVSK